MQLPSHEEQDIAERYVCKRPLNRPDIDVNKAIIYTISFILGHIIIALLFFFLLDKYTIFELFPEEINQFVKDNYWLSFYLFAIIIHLVSIFFCFKYILIGIIRLYQRYADEEVRRRCIFKPTCSEYTILSLKKYGVTIGLYKGYDRLFNRCRGNIYRIDYP